MTLMTVTFMTGFMNTCTHIHHGEFARDDYTPVTTQHPYGHE